MKITIHGELNIYLSFHGNNYAKSRFTATMEITIHKEKISHLTFRGKNGRSRATKIPTLNSRIERVNPIERAAQKPRTISRQKFSQRNRNKNSAISVYSVDGVGPKKT